MYLIKWQLSLYTVYKSEVEFVFLHIYTFTHSLNYHVLFVMSVPVNPSRALQTLNTKCVCYDKHYRHVSVVEGPCVCLTELGYMPFFCLWHVKIHTTL